MKENVVFFALLGLIMGLIYLGFDFSLILFLITTAFGLIWLVDALVFAGRRRVNQPTDASEKASVAPVQDAVVPELVAYAKSFFPVLLAIFVLRSFLFEPFRIPSGSMKPTLLEGDFILVNKFSYGIRLPILNQKIIETGAVQRGDVIVFRFPRNPSVDYIKRVVGLPGDRISYADKTIVIEPACHEADRNQCPATMRIEKQMLLPGGFDDHGFPADIYQEKLGTREHRLLVRPYQDDQTFRYYNGSNEWIVPEGHYFAMGDNRDNSTDGRFWGFVPDENLKGRAIAVWLHLDFGLDIPLLGWVPTGVGIKRIGAIE